MLFRGGQQGVDKNHVITYTSFSTWKHITKRKSDLNIEVHA